MAGIFEKIIVNDNTLKYSTLNEFDNINVIKSVNEQFEKYIIGNTHNTYGKFEFKKSKFKFSEGVIKPDENSFIFYHEYTDEGHIVKKLIRVFRSDNEHINKIVCYGNELSYGELYTTEIIFGENYQIKIVASGSIKLLWNNETLILDLYHPFNKIKINKTNLIKLPTINDLINPNFEFHVIKSYLRMLKENKYYEYLQNINNIQLEQNRSRQSDPNQSVIEKRKCVICIDKIANHIMKECFHLVYCENCNIKNEHLCPICRTNGRSHIIFM